MFRVSLPAAVVGFPEKTIQQKYEEYSLATLSDKVNV